ncbi:MAG: hypothetical protein MN733_17620 [Nitrososphaera sp.]|nr:hypothetical protein [Nitrososphaera sp.]
MNNRPYNLVVISAERAALDSETNAARTSSLRKKLDANGLGYAVARGRYKGVDEASFVVQVPSAKLGEVLPLLRRLGRIYFQESILEVCSRDTVHLVDLTGYKDESQYIGQWREVTAKAAQYRDAYTLVDGRYFIVE